MTTAAPATTAVDIADRARIYLGDSLTVLTDLPNDRVHGVITDPPYNSGGRTMTERSTSTARAKYVSGDARHQLADFVGDNRDQRSYTYWLTLILAECHRATMIGGSALVFTDWRQLPATSDALQAAGWTWRGIITWHKPTARPQRDGFKRDCEYILWGSKGQPHRHTPPIYLPGTYTSSQPRGNNRHHITQKPVELMRDLLQVVPAGGTVLDPFAGSGTTGVAAITEGRAFIGIEATEHYHQISVDRVRDAARGCLRT